jgi:hypothetical protein
LNNPNYRAAFKKFKKNNAELLKLKNEISINNDLQNIVKKNFNEDKTIKQIYDMHILRKKVKQTIETENMIKKVINSSVNYLKISNNKKKYIIYIMADFIDGEVTDENINKIFCPYIGDYLGNMYEFLFQTKLYGNAYDKNDFSWDVNKNRFLFSFKDEENNDKKIVQNEVKKKDNKTDNSDETNEDKIDIERINREFMDAILDKEPNKAEITQLLQNLNKKLTTNIKTKNLLSNFGNKDYQINNKKLYDIIVDMFNYDDDSSTDYKKNENKKNRIITNITNLKIEINKKEKKDKEQLNDKYEEEGLDLITKLHLTILEKLLEYQKEKNKNYGGTQKKYISKKKNNQTKKKRF